MSSWFYQQDGHERGPISATLLKQMAREGLLLPDDQVRKSDWGEFVRAARVAGLFTVEPKPAAGDAPKNPEEAKEFGAARSQLDPNNRRQFFQAAEELSNGGQLDEAAHQFALAQAQRRVLWCILAIFILTVAGLISPELYKEPLMLPLQVTLCFVSTWCLSELMIVLQTPWPWLWLIVQFVPLVYLLVLSRLLYLATRTLRAKGFQVGLFGGNSSLIAQHYGRPDLEEKFAIAPKLSTRRSAIMTGSLFGVWFLVGLFDSRTRDPWEDLGIAESSVTEHDLLAARTLEYWTQCRAVFSDIPSDATSAQLVERFRGQVAQLRAMPSLGVDPEAVALVLDTAALMDRIASEVNRHATWNVYFEALLRGATGDPFGTAVDQSNMQNQIGREASQMDARWAHTRAVLTARYGVEFP